MEVIRDCEANTMMEQKSRVKKSTKITIVIFCAIAVCIVAFILHETNKEEKISFDAAAKIAINDAGFGFYEPRIIRIRGKQPIFTGLTLNTRAELRIK